jgi:hypothetical protein
MASPTIIFPLVQTLIPQGGGLPSPTELARKIERALVVGEGG